MNQLIATRRALDWAEARIYGTATLNDLVWRCLEDAADTLARLPDKERGYLLAADRVAWPAIAHTYEERLEEENQRLELLRRDQSMLRGDGLGSRLPIMDPTAIPRMLTVLSWLQYVRGRTDRGIKRDQLVTLALAQGQTARDIQRRFLRRQGESAVRMVKLKVVGQIAHTLKIQLTLTNPASNCVNLVT